MAEQENWQQFRGSELGGLLSNIYGAPKAQINYPKLSKKKFEPTEAFTSSGAKAHQPTKRNVIVAVPRVGLEKSKSRPSISAVDCIARRKQESIIKAEIDDARMRQNYYRPAHKQTIGDHEKERLNQICQYKGGKILPDDLAYPVSDTPMEVAAIKKENERQSQLADRRHPGRSLNSQAPPVSKMSNLEQMKEQVAGEINERIVHLESMRDMGLSSKDEIRIRSEISSRVAELKKLNDER
jgi:Uncharacterised protein family (UPF0193)